jgi:2-C-methyl-D-erythritol 4-phosphate cytidylyltransferase
MNVAAIVVAGGRGERFGGLKQFEELNGRSLAALSVERCRSVAQRVVLVVPQGYEGAGEGADIVVVGGSSRSQSVRNGLAECHDATFVLIHDAVRPSATRDLFRRVVDALEAGAAAVIPGIPVVDTIKRVRDSVVIDTPDRSELIAVQTPQGFVRELLVRAHESGLDATDDAGLVEALGESVVVVPGESSNLKVTEPSDLDRLRMDV